MAKLEGDKCLIFLFIYVYSGFSTKTWFKYIKTQNIFIKITSIDEAMIMLHEFDSKPKHTFFTHQVFFPSFL